MPANYRATRSAMHHSYDKRGYMAEGEWEAHPQETGMACR